MKDREKNRKIEIDTETETQRHKQLLYCILHIGNNRLTLARLAAVAQQSVA